MDNLNDDFRTPLQSRIMEQLPVSSPTVLYGNKRDSQTAHMTSPQPTSSLYGQSLSVLQSPPLTTKEATPQFTPPRLLLETNPMFASPVRMQSAIQLTSLQPVTPSRVSATPQEICGGTPHPIESTAAITPRLLALPPAPSRVAPRCIMPVVTKKGKGKISITYSPKFFSNQLKAQTDSSGSSHSVFSQYFSQFLSRLNVPTNVPSTESIVRDESSTPASSVDNNQSATVSEVAEEDAVDMDSGKGEVAVEDDEDEEEERKTMTNITKALNINVDMYQEIKKRKKGREFSTKLPKEVQGLMGEANICFAKGDHESALQMCMEIIRTGPWCPEPYELLAILYEEKGDSLKHLQYSLLAAHLQVGDVENWFSLATSCEEAGFLEQAYHCYYKAMKLKPDDYKIMWAAAVIQQQLGNIHRSLSLFKSVVQVIPSDEANRRMTLAHDIAKVCHANNETALGLEVMDEVAVKYPEDIKDEDVNVMCELALISKQYLKVFEILSRHCKVTVQYQDEEASDGVVIPTKLDVPPTLPNDLKCKCVLAAIPLGCIHVVEALLSEMCNVDSSQFGDLQFDIADLFMKEKQYEMALSVLDILVKSEEYSQPVVWMTKAECHQQLGDYFEEVKCLKQVIEKAPGYANAYISLCQVLRKLKHFQEAVEVIRDAESYELDGNGQMLLYYETFNVYKEWATSLENKQEKLCKAGDLGLLMLANKLDNVMFHAKTILIRRVKSKSGIYKGDVRATRTVGKYFFKHADKKKLVAPGSANVIDSEEWWKIFLETCDILSQSERFVDGITIIEVALSHNPWSGKSERKIKMERMACSMSMLGGNYFLAYHYVKTWLLADSSTSVLWNVFNLITVRTGDQRHHRFCLRKLMKDPKSVAVTVLIGHNSLATGTYKYSLGEYMRIHREVPTEPLYALLVGIIYAHIASQRFTTHKNTLVNQSIAFLNRYRQLRKCDQEVYYNIGRMYHQIGLNQFAVQWYKKALETPPPSCDISSDVIDLRSEIGYNLATLYRKSGNAALAMELLRKYCVI